MAKKDSSGKRVRLALVGGETLLGKELLEILEDRVKSAVVSAYSSTGEGSFGEQEGEAVYVQPLDPQSIEAEDAVLVAGSADGAQKAYTLVKAAGGHPRIIDCTGNLEHQPEARIVAPLLGETGTGDRWLLVVAHPAASALALSMKRLAKYRPIRQSVAHIFEPASERGRRGVSELHQQTTSLLSFKALDKNVFDAQLSFNLLPQYGEEAPAKLLTIEQRIERHLATLLANDPKSAVPMPSLRLVQAPVFHGYSISAWVEFEGDIQAGELREALASAQIEVRGMNEEAPNAVGAASQSGLIAGDIRVDRNNARAAWFWLVCDNLRLVADDVASLVTGLEVGQK
ncbi:MAG: hypothetical protein JOY54_11530 [Acidobacteriaceae bacterium]|nr:hypothetical protein [Acidobacteriaceae bacterium]